jgi:hypothetical protein
MFLLEKILIVIGVLLPIGLWYFSYLIYRKYYIKKISSGELINKEVFGDEGGGQMIGDGFMMRPPIPLVDNTSNPEIQLLIKKYNRVIKIFWIWTIIGSILLIIILNLMEAGIP